MKFYLQKSSKFGLLPKTKGVQNLFLSTAEFFRIFLSSISTFFNLSRTEGPFYKNSKSGPQGSLLLSLSTERRPSRAFAGRAPAPQRATQLPACPFHSLPNRDKAEPSPSLPFPFKNEQPPSPPQPCLPAPRRQAPPAAPHPNHRHQSIRNTTSTPHGHQSGPSALARHIGANSSQPVITVDHQKSARFLLSGEPLCDFFASTRAQHSPLPPDSSPSNYVRRSL